MKKNIKLNRGNIAIVINMINAGNTNYKTFMNKLTLADQIEVLKYCNSNANRIKKYITLTCVK